MPGFLYIVVLLVLTLLVQACSDSGVTPGVVARVNGAPITLHEVQTLLDSRSASLGLQTDVHFEDTRRNYGRALSMLIANTLVRQELEEKGMAPNENDLNQALERIVSDYGGESLDAFLEEAMLREEDWKQLMRNHLSLEIFRNQILLPTIKIEFSEAKDYYQAHKNDFTLPETVRACFLASESRETLVEWCADVGARDYVGDTVAQCIETRIEEIPLPWNKELKGLKPMACGKIRNEDGEWQSVALLERHSSRIPELPEVYALIEKILLEPKQSAAFDQWLEQKLKKSKIEIIPELADSLGSDRETGL